MNLRASVVPKSNPYVTFNWRIRTGQINLLYHYIFYTLPRVQKKLSYWEEKAGRSANEELKKQALSSLKNKDFHCQGGAVFASNRRESETILIDLIVAYQTLCDYLDNLCDRANCSNGKAFREIHDSLLDALSPDSDMHDYYKSYPEQNDSGYINSLVLECRQCIKQLPSYQDIYEDVIYLAGLYIDLQVNKHIGWDKREDTLRIWASERLACYPRLLWQEFAAASGSTLAIFALFGLATERTIGKEDSKSILMTYFPWICGLHILLDYFIDQEEDKSGGDLNFTFYYRDNIEMINRMKTFIRQAHDQTDQLVNPTFEKTVIEGLLAMYLSDHKIKEQNFTAIAEELLKESGPAAKNTYRLCRLVRKFL